MDRLKKQRTPLRGMLTKAINEAEVELQRDTPDHNVLRTKSMTLKKFSEKLEDLDQKIVELMIDDADVDETQMETENSTIYEYIDKFNSMFVRISSALQPPLSRPPSPSPSSNSYNSVWTDPTMKRNFKLPKIDLKKFNGDLKDWMSWWAQFQKIHEDETLHASDNFQYLDQCIIKGTRARDLLESYPQTADNYPKVIDALKERFGKDKLLKQVYIRELLKMVINNATSKETIQLPKMFDKLESHLRALESLKVTPDQMAEFLFPMVESSIPEDLLIAWQRSSFYGRDGAKENPQRTELDFLLQFLKQEVEGEEQRKLARAGFDSTVPGRKNDSHAKRIQKEKEHQAEATAAGLHTTGQVSTCIFCGRRNHKTRECRSALYIPLEEKSSKIKDNKVRFICLENGHWWRDCKSQVKCKVCSDRHYQNMCPVNKEDRPQQRQERTASTVTDAAQTNIQCQSDVLLKTILVRVSCKSENVKSGDSVVRLLFDDGSQRSYITTKATKAIKSQPFGHENSRNVLFDGSLTNMERTAKHLIGVESLDGKNKVELVLCERSKIGGSIPQVPQGPWIKELQKRKIFLMDHSLTFVNSPDIEILIGSDNWGRMMTGKSIRMKCGLTATETIFGWTLSGPVGDQAMMCQAITMFDAEDNVTQMWTLEALGIRDPIEIKSKQEEEYIAKQHFMTSVTRDDDGRYSVQLPWIGNTSLPPNKSIAVNRLKSTTKKLFCKISTKCMTIFSSLGLAKA